jgi:hypothetical protein
MVDPLIVDGFIASLNVIVGATLNETPVALFVGDVPVTVGGVVSGAATVVNVAVNGADIELPETSAAPLTVSV